MSFRTSRFLSVCSALIGAAAALSASGRDANAQTLKAVKDRGALVCGVARD